jgi:hypothetical protein
MTGTTTVHAQGTRHALQFATLAGDRFVRLGDIANARPQLIVMWRTDCASCILERPQIDRLAAGHPQWSLVAIALQKRSEVFAWRGYEPTHANFTQLVLADAARGVLARLGNTSGAVPHMAVLDRHGNLCEVLGHVPIARIEDTMRRCSVAK